MSAFRPATIFALVDCNNFYASCEKLFDPTLTKTPLVVLSNNDGCVVARSAEAKKLGVPMAAPWYQLKDMAKQYGIVAKSSNYTLYADLSNRVVEILSQMVPAIEVYSIDESFLDLSGMAHTQGQDLLAYGQQIRQRIAQWLGLAVCVGIASTKTLAKLANHVAKKNLAGEAGVCDFTVMSETALTNLLAQIDVGEVWGVGRKISARLEEMGIGTVLQLRDADTATIRSSFSVVLERTVRELRGISCLDLEEMVPAKQQIMSSRSFGQYIYDLPALQEAVASYIAIAAEKLRTQDSVAGAVQVYIRTNPFKPKEPQYQRAVTVPLPEPTADTRVLTRWALRVLARIFAPGYAYQKAGVMLSDLQPKHQEQQHLFAAAGDSHKAQALMATLDKINQRWGRSTVQLAIQHRDGESWRMKRGNLSPPYTTSWDDIPVVVCK